MPNKHPSAFEPKTLVINLLVSLLGVIIGLELISRLGITTNTSIIGALIAILVARIPLTFLRDFSNLHKQNLMQTAISSATFTAGNALFLPIAVPWLLNRVDLIWPMFMGATLACCVSMTLVYRLFDSRVFPAKNPWPPGIATAETLIAAAKKGKRALLLVYGAVAGVVSQYFFKIPADIAGIAWIGNVWALTMFGVGLVVRGYSTQLIGVDINTYYLPHGMMIGAGLVALIQIILLISKKEKKKEREEGRKEEERLALTRSEKEFGSSLSKSLIAYTLIAMLLAVFGGLYSDMSLPMFILWILFAAFAAMISQLIVGLSAMHAGWFPAFAVALIFLVIGILIGFPAPALGLLVGFSAAAGPAFADMGYDLKTGWILRGRGKDKSFELEGRKQQYFAELTGLVVAVAIVALFARYYLLQDLVPPVTRVYALTIERGASPKIAMYLLLWAIPGAVIQAVGGPNRQLGILFSTGLLIMNPLAGVTCLVAIGIRLLVKHVYKEEGEKTLYILAAGLIAGSALTSFVTSTLGLGGGRKIL